MTLVKRLRADELIQVLTENWQTTSLIALQIVIRPESLARDTVRAGGGGRGRTSLVAETIRHLVGCGDVEMRKGSQGKREYRLTPKGVIRKQQLNKQR